MANQLQEDYFKVFLSERRQIIAATNIVLCCMCLVFSALKISATGTQNFPFPAMLVALLTLINCIYLLRGGSTEKAVLSLLALLFLGLVFSGLNTGAFNGATLILAPILPMLAILWRSTRTGWIMMFATGFSLSLIFWLQLSGYIPENVHSETGLIVIRYVAVVSACLVCTWIAWTFGRYHSELQKINQLQATTDHLTGVGNRRSLEMTLIKEIGRARRSDGWISFVMADVDHFKRYNDLNGHLEGDRCLIQVAEVFSECVSRSADMVGRFGGEEFILLLPDTKPEGARHVAERVRQSMLQRDIPYEKNSPDRVSLTLGVVSVKGKLIESSERLIKLADEALYDGKAAGRNCVVAVVKPNNVMHTPKVVATSQSNLL